MSKSAPDKIRNIAMLAHGGSGKATLIETMLFQAKAISRCGAADKGDQVMITEPEEADRKHAILPHVGHFSWKDVDICILDCPGYFNFLETSRSVLPGADGVVFVFSGVDGAKPESERLWEMVEEAQVPALGFMTNIEDETADIPKALNSISECLGKPAVAVSMPIGEKGNVSGLINLIHMKAWNYKDGKATPTDIPEGMQGELDDLRTQLIERIAEADDTLIEKYLEGEELTEEELDRGLNLAVRKREFIPIMCGCGESNIGVDALNDAIVHYLPSPVERDEERPFTGADDVTRKCSVDEPFSALVLKTTIDPFSGKLSIVRVVSGSVTGNETVYSATKQNKQKTGHVYLMQGKEIEQVESLSAGQIGAIAKMEETGTCDTLCDPQNIVCYPRVTFAQAQNYYTVEAEPKSEDKVAAGLAKLVDEDPSLRLHRDEQTLEMILSGMGQVHLEVSLERLSRKFGGRAKLRVSKVPYRETIRKKVKKQGKLKKQTGGHGQFANCWLEVEPLPRDQGFEFVDLITGGIIPKQFIPSIEKGVMESLKKGILGGNPVVDVKASVYDGSFHTVDSSDHAFQVAGAMAFKGALEEAESVLLEPIMSMEVLVPDDLTGDGMKDLSSRRGRVLGMDSMGKKQLIRAEVPLAEVLEYGNALSAITSGRGTYTMKVCAYNEVPHEIADKLLAALKAEEEAAEG
ncbi:elongation factor G [Oligoflexia bacterium]|nr:elongation factor G [Oligoflexia bacterium]